MRAIVLFFLAPLALLAQPTKEFNMAFYKSRELLYYGKFKEALPVLQQLDSLDRNNPNVQYLLGVSYIASGIDLEKGITKLEASSPFITNAYRSGQSAERNAPIYNWYYLGVGYSFTGQCDKAEAAFIKFKSFISDPGDSYVADADSKIIACKNEAQQKESKKETLVPQETVLKTTPDTLNTTLVSSRPMIPNTNSQGTAIAVVSRSSISTRTVIYTTKSPLYAVQVGAFDKLLPANEFRNLKNVHSFVDRKGVVRYVVGNCVMRSQAENLRKAVIEAGYKDAFIVDINTEEKFSEEVIHSSKSSGRKEYRVQLGVFRSEIPEELSKVYLKIDDVKETHEGELTILTSGTFRDHASALKYRDEMITLGVPGAFVVVFVNGKRQSLASVN